MHFRAKPPFGNEKEISTSLDRTCFIVTATHTQTAYRFNTKHKTSAT